MTRSQQLCGNQAVKPAALPRSLRVSVNFLYFLPLGFQLIQSKPREQETLSEQFYLLL
jgi:hypothetical protein